MRYSDEVSLAGSVDCVMRKHVGTCLKSGEPLYEYGVVVPSTSPYNAPHVLAPKATSPFQRGLPHNLLIRVAQCS